MDEFIIVYFYVLAGLIGLCVGSFLNVVIYRVPLNMSVVFPASHCPNCSKPIKWYDNIPVLSYTLLGGKCRNCKVHIPFRYTAVEILNTVLWLLSAYLFLPYGYIYPVIMMAVSSVLICVFFIDLEHKIIPDRFIVILILLGIASVFFDLSDYAGRNHFLSNIIGAVAGFLIFLLIGFAVSKLKGREALGGGDVKLAFAMGLLLGWQRLILAFLISSLSACAVILISKAVSKNKEEDKEYPFAPFLSSGLLVSLFFGDFLINLYMSILLN